MNITHILKRFIDWLEKDRFVNILFIAAYFIFIYYMHDPVVHLSVWVMNLFSLPIYNKVVIAISVLLLTLFVVFLAGQLNHRRDNLKLKVVYLFITLALIIVHYRTMFEMNIEIIHIFEYPFLSLLIFPLTRRFGATVLFTIPFMLLDEWHQYIVLYPVTVEYFEFNDIVMDTFGSGLAMVTLFICGVDGEKNIKPVWKRSEFISILVCLALIALAVKFCFVSLYASGKCDNTWLVLNRIPGIQGFWRQFPGREVIYHVMQPVEALISIPLLAFYYFGLDSFRK